MPKPSDMAMGIINLASDDGVISAKVPLSTGEALDQCFSTVFQEMANTVITTRGMTRNMEMCYFSAAPAVFDES